MGGVFRTLYFRANSNWHTAHDWSRRIAVSSSWLVTRARRSARLTHKVRHPDPICTFLNYFTGLVFDLDWASVQTTPFWKVDDWFQRWGWHTNSSCLFPPLKSHVEKGVVCTDAFKSWMNLYFCKAKLTIWIKLGSWGAWINRVVSRDLFVCLIDSRTPKYQSEIWINITLFPSIWINTIDVFFLFVELNSLTHSGTTDSMQWSFDPPLI